MRIITWNLFGKSNLDHPSNKEMGVLPPFTDQALPYKTHAMLPMKRKALFALIGEQAQFPRKNE